MSDEKINESTTCMRLIDPKLKESGWELDDIDREYKITRGKIVPEGRSGKRNDPLIADYVLKLGGTLRVAIVEAKSVDKAPDHGMQQAINYANMLNLKFAYSTNGKEIEEYDFTTKQQKSVDRFPTPDELFKRAKDALELDESQMETLMKPYDRGSQDPAGRPIEARYYQEIAINAATTSILHGKKRVLLTLATGTGKTFIAYQLAKRLWNSKSPRPKILFLADRTVLLDQAKNNAFASFGDLRHRIQKKLETAYEIYFALYQALDVDKEEGELYKQYPSDFFDYVIIDECHRGSSTESGNWRKILEHFDGATHIGMTATPKRDDESKDTYDYFGMSVYEYSLKQGIEDGFLAPYIIHEVKLDSDAKPYFPKKDERDVNGKLLEKREYTYKDYDRILIRDDRRKTVAQHLINFLEKNQGKFDKTILFCQTSEHALAMTKLLRNYSGEGHDYVARIVSAEGELGKEFLDRFQTPNEDFPVIAVTSRLMSTGVDVPTCRVIALDKNINSMTEFKQIIGRGTRVFEPKDKMWFSIVDYRKTTRLFKDEEWDGPPIAQTEEEFEEITEEKEQRLIQKAQEKRRKQIEEPIIEKPKEERKTEVYHIEGTTVKVMWESVLIFDQSIDGNRLISNQDYTGEQVRRIVNDEQTQLYKIWTNPKDRKHFVDELQKRGITFEHLKEISKLDKVDAFDMLLHFAFNADTKTRQARVNSVKSKPFFERYPEKARELLEVILDHYAEVGYQELEGREILTLDKFKPFGGPLKILSEVFKDGEEYDGMINEITKELYAEY
jgi:type I restriction enzyme, R subunit